MRKQEADSKYFTLPGPWLSLSQPLNSASRAAKQPRTTGKVLIKHEETYLQSRQPAVLVRGPLVYRSVLEDGGTEACSHLSCSSSGMFDMDPSGTPVLRSPAEKRNSDLGKENSYCPPTSRHLVSVRAGPGGFLRAQGSVACPSRNPWEERLDGQMPTSIVGDENE